MRLEGRKLARLVQEEKSKMAIMINHEYNVMKFAAIASTSFLCDLIADEYCNKIQGVENAVHEYRYKQRA